MESPFRERREVADQRTTAFQASTQEGGQGKAPLQHSRRCDAPLSGPKNYQVPFQIRLIMPAGVGIVGYLVNVIHLHLHQHITN